MCSQASGEFVIVVGSTLTKGDTILKLIDSGSISIRNVDKSSDHFKLDFEILCMNMANFIRFFYEYAGSLKRELKIASYIFNIYLDGYNNSKVDYSMVSANANPEFYDWSFSPEEGNDIVHVVGTQGDITGLAYQYESVIKILAKVILEVAYKVKGKIAKLPEREARLELSEETVMKTILRFIPPEVLRKYDEQIAIKFVGRRRNWDGF